MSARRIEVEVSRVVLHGIPLPAAEQAQLRRALEAELARQFGATERPRRGREGPAAEAQIEWAPGGNAGELGRRVGVAVGRSVPR